MAKIGIDLGGSHIAIGFVEKGEILEKKNFIYKNEENNDSLQEVFKIIEKYIKEVSKTYKIESIGISLPGNCKDGVLLDATNIKNFNMAGLHVVEIVQERLNIPTYIENDALCALLGERRYGVLKEYKNAIMFTFGTDVGYAMCFEEDGKEYFLDMNSRDFLFGYSTSFEESLMGLLTLKNVYSRQIHISEISKKKIFEDIKNDNKEAAELLEKYVENNCKGIERLSKLTKVDTFCIGGGLSEHGELFINTMQEKLPNLNIFIAKNMNDAGLIGATEIKGICKKDISFKNL